MYRGKFEKKDTVEQKTPAAAAPAASTDSVVAPDPAVASVPRNTEPVRHRKKKKRASK